MTTPQRSFLAEVKALPKPIWILSGGVFLDRFALFVLPFLVLFITAEGYSKSEAAIAVSLVSIGSFCAAIIGGYLSDRIGRRKTIAISMIGGAILSLVLYAATKNSTSLGGLWATYLTGFLYGSFRGMYHTASSSLVGDLVSPEGRIVAFAVIRFAINLGFALGLSIAGFVAETSFLALFVFDAITSVAFGVIAVLFLPHGVRTTSKAEGRWSTALKRVRTDRTFLLVCLNGLGIALVFTQYHTSYPVFLKESGHPTRWFGLLMGINGFMITFLEMPISALVRRFSPRAVIGIGAVLVGIGFGLNVWIASTLGLVIGIVVMTFGEMIALPMQGSVVSELAPARMRGRYNGMMGMMWSTSGIIGPILGLQLLGYGADWLCNVFAGLAILCAASMYFVKHEKPSTTGSNDIDPVSDQSCGENQPT